MAQEKDGEAQASQNVKENEMGKGKWLENIFTLKVCLTENMFSLERIPPMMKRPILAIKD